jgi:diguanylate cyclase (GGDEF)-like protein/PAS domain S-box-containing protein
MRMSIALACLTLTILFCAQSIGLVPDQASAEHEGRKNLCEAVAVQCCIAAQRNDLDAMRTITRALVSRNPNVQSAAVRRASGQLLVEAGEHGAQWQNVTADADKSTQIVIPVVRGTQRWGAVEIRFKPLAHSGFFNPLMHPVVRLAVFVAGCGLLSYTFYLKRVLQHLDPNSVIPDRVRATLDTLAEGVLVLDKDQRIVLANKAFAHTTGRSVQELQGFRAFDISWSQGNSNVFDEELPWAKAIRDGEPQTGVMLGLQSKMGGMRTFMVNASPIFGSNGRQRGALATFDDVTSIEKKNLQLEQMLQVLKDSRDEIRRQNDELHVLATRDPLTSCLNRRAFFMQFETLWAAATNRGQTLSCVMVDIDHFKSINDTHGHSTGDQVLQRVAATLRERARENDLVCRYGGEEFCVLLPHTDLDEAMVIAERLRERIAEQSRAVLPITASLGLSALTLGATEARELLEQADQGLYASKRLGRDRVTAWNQIPAGLEPEKVAPTSRRKNDESEQAVPIPFHAVAALTSALAYRDTLTAEHSRRVADLCVATARGLVSEKACYVLEVAALLHDIGKLGVPDAILLKPGSLTAEEWKIMSTHDRIGVEIITAAFSSHELTEIVRTHHAWYAGNPRDAELPTGEGIPLGARILTIADAYDAMVSDRVYRKGRTRAEAFAELRNCADRQFDRALVERFIEAVSSNDESRVAPPLAVSKHTALRIGLQIERLASALDAQDFPNLSAMAGRLTATATKEGVPQIAELAAELEQAASSEPDLINIVQLTTDLLELCRSTQSSYLSAVTEDEFAD